MVKSSVFILLLFWSSFIFAKLTLRKQLTPDDIFYLKQALVEIVISEPDTNEIINTATGFFISSKGRLLTAAHAIEPYIGKKKITIFDKNQVVLEDFSIAKCGSDFKKGEKIVDVCLINVWGYKNLPHFPMYETEVGVGSQVYLLSLLPPWRYGKKKGKIDEIHPDHFATYPNPNDPYEYNRGTEMIEPSFIVQSGESGSPFISEWGGQILGIWAITRPWKNGKLAPLATSMKEIRKILKGPSRYGRHPDKLKGKKADRATILIKLEPWGMKSDREHESAEEILKKFNPNKTWH